LHAAIDALDQVAADMLGVSRNDLRCLNLLEQGPLTPSSIAQALRLTSGSVTALLDRLEAKGLVERSRDPSDRRGIRVSMTPIVFATVGRLYRSCAETLLETVAMYPSDEREAAVRHLSDAASAWERASSEPVARERL
jgi:DNA-binding MarR family transcriptional regulator